MNFSFAYSNSSRKLVTLSALVLIVSMIAACSSGPKPTARLEDFVAQETESQQQVQQLNDKLFASAGGAPQMQDYVLGEGDLLQVTVFESAELNTDARVGARGLISLPLVGTVDVKGLTVREAEQKIEDLFRQKYIQDPHVNVFVKEHVSGKITILGAVNKPGTFDHLTRRRVLDVLAVAEGLTDKAGRTVQLRRPSEDPEHPTLFFVDLDELIDGGRSELNLEVKSGDSLYVPPAGTVYVDGAVRKPGNYPITPKMSLQEAIAAAGGFSTTAKESDIKLVRPAKDGKKDVVQLSLKSAEEGSRSVEIRDRDVVFVETSALEKVVYGLRLNFGNLLLGLGVGYTPPSQ